MLKLYLRWLSRTVIGKEASKSNSKTANRWFNDLRLFFEHRASMIFDKADVRQVKLVGHPLQIVLSRWQWRWYTGMHTEGSCSSSNQSSQN